MAKEAIKEATVKKTVRKPREPKNNNLGSFVDAVTPEPKIILENYLNMERLSEYLKKATPEQRDWVNSMIDIVLSINKQEQFITLGQQIAMNSLRKLNILV